MPKETENCAQMNDFKDQAHEWECQRSVEEKVAILDFGAQYGKVSALISDGVNEEICFKMTKISLIDLFR